MSDVRVRIVDLEAAAGSRPPGYLDVCLAAGIRDGEWLVFEEEVYRALQRQFGGEDGQRCSGCGG